MPAGCLCGNVLKGLVPPEECPLFGAPARRKIRWVRAWFRARARARRYSNTAAGNDRNDPPQPRQRPRLDELLHAVILPELGADPAAPLEDAAVFALPQGRCAFTTDSFVIRPLEFPGGDIGKLSVCGTVNDLAMVGRCRIRLRLP